MACRQATSPFSRGGKGDGAGQRDGGDFTRVVGMEMFGAAGGASSSPTKSEGDSADAKQTVLWKEVSEVVIFEG